MICDDLSLRLEMLCKQPTSYGDLSVELLPKTAKDNEVRHLAK